MPLFSVPFKAMGTVCQIRLSAGSFIQAQQLAAPGIAEVERLEAKYSRYIPSSVLSCINAQAGVAPYELDDETQGLLRYAASAYTQSEGLFDITSGVLRQLWDFKIGTPVPKCIPSADRIQQQLTVCGWPKLNWQGEGAVCLPKGFELDFGGFVKEFAADCVIDVLAQKGLSKVLVDLGGDIAVSSHDGDDAWPIAIKDPVQPKQKIAQLHLASGGFATSGNYERFVMLEGKRYSHILNPRTGWPVATPASVSVVANNCLIAGTVSTVAMLAGEQECITLLESFELPFCCVMNNGRVINRLSE